MKKFLAACMIAAVATTALAGCGNNQAQTENQTNNNATTNDVSGNGTDNGTTDQVTNNGTNGGATTDANNNVNGETGTSQAQSGPLNDLLNEMVAQDIVRSPLPIDDTLAQDAYHIDLNIVDEYAIAETGISPGPGLAVMVKAKPGKVEEAKANMDALLQDRIGSAFYPAEQEAAEQAEVMVEGDYVALFILNDVVRDTGIKMFRDFAQ